MTSWLFKTFDMLRENAITETFLITALSMMAYFITEMTVIMGINMSGIIALLTCGIVQSHYTYYNLSDQGKITSTLTSRFLGMTAEAGIYSYIGLSLYSSFAHWWSWEFIFYQTILIICGRYFAIFFVFYSLTICFKSRTISAKELFFIGWGGMIRGAIAFALVMRIPLRDTHSCQSEHPIKDCYSEMNFELMITTTFALIVFTTVVFGFLMSAISSCLFSSKKDKSNEETAALKVEVHEHEEHLIKHPNEETDDEAPLEPVTYWRWVDSGLVRWYGRFHESTLKPAFIR